MDANELPPEVWLTIFSFTSPRTVTQSIALVSHHWNEITKDESLWKSFCVRLTGVDSKPISSKSWCETFEEASARHFPSYTVWSLLGHVDSGKSTLAGHLMCYTNETVWKKDIERCTDSTGKSWFKYAFCSDTLRAEQERDLTLKCHLECCTYGNYSAALINTPGHRDYMNTTYSGAALGDNGILVVPLTDGEFEAGISRWGQTRSNALLARAMGLKKLIVAVNKIDAYLGGPLVSRYDEVVAEMKALLKRIGFAEKDIFYVPISAWTGENLGPWNTTRKVLDSYTLHKDWYKGPSLWDLMCSIPEPTRRIFAPLRMTIHTAHMVDGIGLVLVGKVLQGILRLNDRIILTPALHCIHKEGKEDLCLTVRSIEKHHQPLLRAIPGDIVGLNIVCQGVELTKECFQSGIVLSHYPSPSKEDPSPPQVFARALCRIMIDRLPAPIKPGWEGVMLCHTAQIPIKILAFKRRVNWRTGEPMDENPRTLRARDGADVVIVPSFYVHLAHQNNKRPKNSEKKRKRRLRADRYQGHCVDNYTGCNLLGRFAIVNSHELVAMGLITTVNPPLPPPNLTVTERERQGMVFLDGKWG